MGLPTEWSRRQKHRLEDTHPGKRLFTSIVTARHIWVTSATPDGDDSVYGLDRATGAIFFEKKLFHSDAPEPLGNDVNGYASPSGRGRAACLRAFRQLWHGVDEATCAEVWRRTDLPCLHYPRAGLVAGAVGVKSHSLHGRRGCAVSDGVGKENGKDGVEDGSDGGLRRSGA